MSEYQFGHMSLEELKFMAHEVIADGPNEQDMDFIKALSNEIARREKSKP